MAIPLIIIGNKIDLPVSESEERVKEESATKLCEVFVSIKSLTG